MNKKTYPVISENVNEMKFKIVEHGLLTAGTEWNYKQVVSPFNRLYFVTKGEAWIENSKARKHLRSGFLYLIPAGVRYDYWAETQFQKLYMHFELQLIPGIDIFDGCSQAMERAITEEEQKEFQELIEENTVSNALCIKVRLLQVVSSFLIQAKKEQKLERDYRGFYKQREVLNYLSRHLSAKTKVEDIARQRNMSYFSLSRDFKKDTGMGLKQYMEEIIMNKARQQLLTTNLRISEIAYELGFTDAYYFSKFFRNHEKISPREYRKMSMLRLLKRWSGQAVSSCILFYIQQG